MNGVIFSEEFGCRDIYEIFVDEDNHPKLIKKLLEFDEQEVWTFKARKLHSECAKMLRKEILKQIGYRVKKIDFAYWEYNEKYCVYCIRAWEV